MTTRFRVPETIDPDGNPIGMPETVGRNEQYDVDPDTGLIVVEDEEDAVAFRQHGWTEVLDLGEVQQAAPTKRRTVADTQGTKSGKG
jgi:hypothetical protein